MGMLDRDYYQEHWLEKVLGVKPKQPPVDAQRGPIYVNRSGEASTAWRPPRRRLNLPLWPFVTLGGCIGLALAFAGVVKLVRVLA